MLLHTKLNEYLRTKGHTSFEGNSADVPQQTQDLIDYCKQYRPKRVMEIGFNGGHSANIFLQQESVEKVVSFDIGTHDYVTFAKEFVDMAYPSKHELVLGNSLETVPLYNSEPFDMIFIDGCHDYEYAINDLLNCKRLAHSDTIVIIDDTTYTPGWSEHWTIGPTRAWLELVEKGVITEIARPEYMPGRGQSIGKYLI